MHPASETLKTAGAGYLTGLLIRSNITPELEYSMELVPDYSKAERLAGDSRHVRAGLRAFFAIADRWDLRVDEARRLLGSPSESTYHGWKSRGVAKVSPDVMVRISYIIGIAALLERLFAGAPDRANTWMRQPNTGPFTRGRTALDYLLEGGLVAMDELHGLLQSDAGAGSPLVPASRATRVGA
jgi:Protein of unknown function (DUF2384)